MTTDTQANRHEDRAQANILYITAVYVRNKFSPRTMKFSEASQDDTAREINSLAPDKKLLVSYKSFNFAAFSLRLAYALFSPTRRGATFTFLFAFHFQENISSNTL